MKVQHSLERWLYLKECCFIPGKISLLHKVVNSLELKIAYASKATMYKKTV
jgi:hypothetical protein